MTLDVLPAAARYHTALTAGMATAGTRSLADGPTAGELLLEAGFGWALRPALGDLYRLPIAERLGEMMTQSREEIVRTTLRLYRERPDVVDAARDRMRPYLRRGFNLGGQMGLDALELDGWFELTDDHIGGVLESHAGRLVDTRRRAEMSLLVTTAEEIGREVSRRREDGMSVADLLPALSAWVLGRTVIRSTIIAETETVRMSRWGMLWAFAGNGIRGVVHECALDVEQRCSGACPPLCGTEYELSGVFNPMGGIPAAGQIPLHPRCILPGNEVVIPGRLSAAAKSYYHGRAIEIIVGDGRFLTVTENHPILTPDGWVPAKLLRQGDYVLGTTDAQRIAAAVNPDDDHSPTAIEKIFGSFKESRSVSSVVVPHTAEDFHGDGRNIYGDIDVVYSDRYRVGVEPKTKLASILDNAGALDEPDDGAARHALLACKFVDRFAGHITADEIVGIREFDFSGHVYDLQCDDYELYTTSGIITSNCRCWYSPLRDGWLKPALIWTGFALGALE